MNCHIVTWPALWLQETLLSVLVLDRLPCKFKFPAYLGCFGYVRNHTISRISVIYHATILVDVWMMGKISSIYP